MSRVKVPAFDPSKVIIKETHEGDKLRLEAAVSIVVVSDIDKIVIATNPEVIEHQKHRIRDALEVGFIDSFVGYLKSRGQQFSKFPVPQKVFVVREDLQEDIIIMSAKRYAEEVKKR